MQSQLYTNVTQIDKADLKIVYKLNQTVGSKLLSGPRSSCLSSVVPPRLSSTQTQEQDARRSPPRTADERYERLASSFDARRCVPVQGRATTTREQLRYEKHEDCSSIPEPMAATYSRGALLAWPDRAIGGSRMRMCAASSKPEGGVAPTDQWIGKVQGYRWINIHLDRCRRRCHARLSASIASQSRCIDHRYACTQRARAAHGEELSGSHQSGAQTVRAFEILLTCTLRLIICLYVRTSSCISMRCCAVATSRRAASTSK